MAGERSLSCTAGHLFDLSRDGYVHLLPNAKPGKYEKELFAARRLINDAGYFDLLLEHLFSVINGNIRPDPADSLALLMPDAAKDRIYPLCKPNWSLP